MRKELEIIRHLRGAAVGCENWALPRRRGAGRGNTGPVGLPPGPFGRLGAPVLTGADSSLEQLGMPGSPAEGCFPGQVGGPTAIRQPWQDRVVDVSTYDQA